MHLMIWSRAVMLALAWQIVCGARAFYMTVIGGYLKTLTAIIKPVLLG